MQVYYIGSVIAIIVLILCILGIIGVLPETSLVLFGLLAGLAIAFLVGGWRTAP